MPVPVCISAYKESNLGQPACSVWVGMACSDKQEETDPISDSKQCSLFEACKRGDLELIKRILTSDTINAQDLAGRKNTPLHFAAGQYSLL